MKIERHNLEIGRDNGDVEFPVIVADATAPTEHLVWLCANPSRHVSVIDPHDHPKMHPDISPEEHAERVKKFLDLGGASWLGHPSDHTGISRHAEVDRIKAKYGLKDQVNA